MSDSQEVHYNDKVQLRTSAGLYLCYQKKDDADIYTLNSVPADYSSRFTIYHYHWDKKDPIKYSGPQGSAEHLTSQGNFRLSCDDIPGDEKIVAPQYNGSVGDTKYSALPANTDRDGANNYETFFFVNAHDTSSSAQVRYGDAVRIFNFAKGQPFAQTLETQGSRVQCVMSWPGAETFVIEKAG